jgi:nardilysin
VHHAGNGLATVGPLFEYLRLLRAAGPQRWVFEELGAIARLKFQWAEEEEACELVSRLACDMPLYAPAHALCGTYLYEDWRPELVWRAGPSSCALLK